MGTNPFGEPDLLPYYDWEMGEKLGQAFLYIGYRHQVALEKMRVFAGPLLLLERHVKY